MEEVGARPGRRDSRFELTAKSGSVLIIADGSERAKQIMGTLAVKGIPVSEVTALRLKGLAPREIAEHFGCSKSTITYHLRRHLPDTASQSNWGGRAKRSWSSGFIRQTPRSALAATFQPALSTRAGVISVPLSKPSNLSRRSGCWPASNTSMRRTRNTA